jgi:hypothetical protein
LIAASGSATTCTAANATRLRIGPPDGAVLQRPESVYGASDPSARGRRSVRVIAILLGGQCSTRFG